MTDLIEDVKDDIRRARGYVKSAREKCEKLDRTRESNIDLIEGRDVKSRTYRDEDGVIRWENNDSIPPGYILFQLLEDDHLEMVRQFEARAVESAKKIAEYKKRRKESGGPSAAQKAEMRSAFGKGEEVVDVLSGETFTT
jgi:hypothetical protein